VTLNDLSVRALHRLDAANSRLRHSVVEACFYNLRMLAQELPGRRAGNGGFMKNLADALAKVADARRLTEEYFACDVAPNVRVRNLFTSEGHAVSQSFADIEGCRQEGIPSRDDAPACQRFAERVVGDVDDILSAVDRIREATRGRRIPVREALEELVAIHRGACEAEGVSLELTAAPEDDLQVFADRPALLDALSELIRNALKYAFPACLNGEKRIALRLEVDEESRDAVIAVADTGCGMTAERLERVGAAGASTSGGGDGVAMVRRIIEGEHLGLVTYQSELEKGTTVRVRLPRRAEPPVEEAIPVGGVAPAQVSTRRKLAAVGAFVLILAAGLLAAWQVMRSPGGLVVAADGSGDYVRVSQAIEAIEPGGTITVEPGEYVDHLVIDKPVTIVGEGERAATIKATRSCVVIASAKGAVLRNLRLLLDADIPRAAVFVESGDVVIEDCEISSRGLSCVEVAGGSPTVRGCLIHDGARSGIFVHDAGAGLYENNTIQDCEGWGITVSDNAKPTLRDNVITNCTRGAMSGRSDTGAGS